jgi:hypothetical protein
MGILTVLCRIHRNDCTSLYKCKSIYPVCPINVTARRSFQMFQCDRQIMQSPIFGITLDFRLALRPWPAVRVNDWIFVFSKHSAVTHFPEHVSRRSFFNSITHRTCSRKFKCVRKRNQIIRDWRKLHNEELHNL